MKNRRAVLGLVAGMTGAGCLRLAEEETTPEEETVPEELNSTETAAVGPQWRDELSPAQSWPQFQYDSGNTGNVEGGGLEPTPPGVAWERQTTSPSRNGLLATGEYLIDSRGSSRLAYEKATGEMIWDTEETLHTEISMQGDPVVVDRQVLFAGRSDLTGNYELWSIDAEDGSERWKLEFATTNEFFSAITVHDDVAFVLRQLNSNDEIRISALSLSERDELWEHKVEAFEHVNRAVAAADGIVAYSGYMEYDRTGSSPESDDSPGGVVALDARTGETQWITQVGGTQPSPSIANGLVYATPEKTTIEYADLQDGGPYPIFALDVDTGDVEWHFEGRNTFYNSPAVTADRVYFGSGDTAWALDAQSGEPVWSTDIGRSVDRADALVIDEILLLADSDRWNHKSHVNALATGTGEHLWAHEVPEMTIESLVSVDGVVFVKGESYDADEDNTETIRGLW